VSAPFGTGRYDPESAHEVAWSSPSVDRVVGLRFADAFGMFGIAREPGRAEHVDGRECVAGGFLAIDVAGLQDIDGDVDLHLVIDRDASDAVLVGFDANGSAENARLEVAPAGDGRWAELRIRLERARFAGRGPRGTDILLAAPGADFTDPDGGSRLIRIAAIDVRPVGDPAPPPADAVLRLRLTDERGQPTAARVGVYATDGREVLPGPAAVPIGRYGEAVRHVALRSISAEESGPGGPREPWPLANRWCMYVDGDWEAEVPSGAYDLVVTKGPEFRWARRRLQIEPGGVRLEDVVLERWTDTRAVGWWSGDAHVHLTRDGSDDPALIAVAAAEDVGVVNLLRMGNLSATAYEQAAFGPAGWMGPPEHRVAAGQEDPRTGRRGHTLHLNVAEPVRDPDRYFLYHETFERLRAGGAITGYAHAGTGWFDELAGLALDVPFGLVDLIEVAQAGLRTDPWYDFLNLGFRLTPVAGSDWPYINAVGTVRSYVRLPAGPTLPAWFDALREGRAFVTNGPLLELDVGGAGMGDERAVEPGDEVTVRATARLNPDLGPLERLELVVSGESGAAGTIEPGGETAALEHVVSVVDGGWVAVRAVGADRTFAHSAPVYLPIDGATWSADAAPRILQRVRSSLSQLLSGAPDVWDEDLEPWDSEERYADTWARLLPELQVRVEEARRRYDALETRILGAQRP
jgi:hypothetical protein